MGSNVSNSANLSSSPSSTNASAVVLTPAELWIQLVVFYFLLGVLSAFGYGAMAVGIVRSKNKNLKNRFFMILCFVLLARFLVSAQMITNFVYRSLRTLGFVPGTLPRWACYLTHVNANFSFTLEMVTLLVLVVDRMAAVIFFNAYRNLTVRQAVVSCLVATLATIVLKLGPSFIDVNFRENVTCVNAYSGNGSYFNSYTQNIDLALALLLFFMYFVLIMHLRWVSPVVNDKRNPNEKRAFKRQMRLLPVLRRLVLIHCAFSFLAKLLLGVANQFPDAIQQRFTAYGGMMQIVDMFVNAIVLLCTNRELRVATFPCLTSTKVGSDSGTKSKHAPPLTVSNKEPNVMVVHVR